MHRFVKYIWICFFLIGASIYAKSYQFHFNPSRHMSYKYCVESIKTVDIGVLETTSETRRVTTNVTISETKNGYKMSHTIENIEILKDDAPVYSPLIPIMKQMSFTYILDKEGHLLDVQGIDQFLDHLSSMFPPEVMDQLSSFLNTDVLLNKERAEYEGRYGKYIGKEVNKDEVWSEEIPFELPGMGKITYYMITTFKKKSRKNLSVSYTYVTDTTDLSKLPELIQEALSNRVLDSDMNTLNGQMNISGEGEVIIDPSTMQIYSETDTRRITQEMVIPNRGSVESRLTETKKTKFIYY